MNRLFLWGPVAIFSLLAIGAFKHDYPVVKPKPCTCDTLQTKATVTDPNYDRMPQYDADELTDWDFYKLDSTTNRMLWYRDVESVDSTKLTAYWNDYYQNNYHLSQLDFIKYYTGRPGIEMAFLLGPNRADLLAYHIFVVKKVGCCYVLTRNYFRHARFTYKAYAILNQPQVDSLHILVDRTSKVPMGDTEHKGYAAYFTDNCNQQQYFIDLQKKPDGDTAAAAARANLRALLHFVDKRVAWNKTYPLQ